VKVREENIRNVWKAKIILRRCILDQDILEVPKNFIKTITEVLKLRKQIGFGFGEREDGLYLFLVGLLDLTVLFGSVVVEFGCGEGEDVEESSGNASEDRSSPVDLRRIWNELVSVSRFSQISLPNDFPRHLLQQRFQKF
jgi:hypothetical protein